MATVRARRTVAGVIATVLVAVAAGPAAAWDGERAPNDPGYAGQWFLSSTIPAATPLATDPEGAAGMSIDRAWARYGAGRPDVRVAYIEGGVNWRTENAQRELAPRAYLNTGELPLPEGSARYDANGDGQVNVADYANDSRVHRPYVNGALTPEDLIVAFSDGRDDDRNGYVDDISGYNFSRANNDPQTEDSAYTHANSQMMQAVAEADNGFRNAGICPKCTVIPVKTGDEALTRPDRFAQGIYFSVDSGASVIVAVVAELSYTRLVKRALQYAWDKGVVVVEASNDFDSADHQAGMFWPRVWPGNGLVADTAGFLGDVLAPLTTTFRRRSNYTSFGTHSLFSMPNAGGTTSESTPTQGGVAALMAAYGRRAAAEHRIDGRLDAGEIKQLLRASSSPIPGDPGKTFTLQFGYGRPNVDRALSMLLAGNVPPVPDMVRPSWYARVDPTRTAAVPIRADVEARRAGRVSWEVQYALGAEPAEGDFTVLKRGTSSAARFTASGRLDLSRIPRSLWERPLEHTNDLSSTEQHTVTLRIQVTDDRGLMGEDRRAIAVVHDPALRRGFPVEIGIGHESSPVPADLDGDGGDDLVFGDGNGAVHAVDARGRELPGWPAHTSPLALGLADTPAGRAGAVPPARDPVVVPPAIGDLDGDGHLDVVATSPNGRLYVFDDRGRLEPGWPKQLAMGAKHLSVPPPDAPHTRLPSQGAFDGAVLAPLPGGSKLDIVQGAWDGRLYAFAADGTPVPGWPVNTALPADRPPVPPATYVADHKVVATPVLADLDGDGRPELVVKSQEFALFNQDLFGVGSRFFVNAFWADGNDHAGGARVPGWPLEVQGVLGAYGTAQDFITEGGDAASAGDVDGDGRDEVVQPLVFSPPVLLEQASARDAAAGRLADRVLQELRGSPRALLRRSRAAGTPLAFPVGFTAAGALARIGGQLRYAAGGEDLLSLTALLFPGQPAPITSGVRVLDPLTGAEAPGFAAPLMGLPFLTGPAVADITGDGRPEVIVGSDTSTLAAVQDDGTSAPGWPKFTGGWTLFTPAVADLDGDGRVEVAVTTREGKLLVWNTRGRAKDVQAGTWHRDAAHTGRAP